MVVKIARDKPSDKEILVDCMTLEVGENGQQEKKEVEQSCSLEIENHNTAKETSRNVVVTDEQVLNVLRTKVLFRYFLDRFLEMVVILQVLLVAINCVPLRHLIEQNFWPLEIFALILLIVWQFLLTIPTLRQVPGFYVPKMFYLLFLMAIYLIIGIHFPRFFPPDLSPYFAVVATGTAGASYILLAILTITKIVEGKGSSLYLCGLIVPIYVLVASQTVYTLAFTDTPFNVFMLNVGAGVLIGVYFSLAQVFYNKRYVNSEQFAEIARRATRATVPTTESTGETENKNGNVETV